MIKAAVLGATGYAGIELVRLLTSHPEVSIEILGSHSFAGQKISDVYKNFNHVLERNVKNLTLIRSVLVMWHLPHFRTVRQNR